jgi:hypothetical protein
MMEKRAKNVLATRPAAPPGAGEARWHFSEYIVIIYGLVVPHHKEKGIRIAAS